jgi:hypothetical protein
VLQRHGNGSEALQPGSYLRQEPMLFDALVKWEALRATDDEPCLNVNRIRRGSLDVDRIPLIACGNEHDPSAETAPQRVRRMIERHVKD